MSRASNLAGFTTSISPPANLSVGIITASSVINVGTGLTLSSSGINVSGVITATSFSGNGSGLTGVGLGTTGSINTSGIITATTLTIGAGTTALPSISPTGDSNTGIFFPSADTIAFAEGGAEAMRVDSSGRLLSGISTSGNANGGPLQLSGGITFPATAVAASDANTLDDYEEGTFTPQLKFGGASVGMSGAFEGVYTKVGRLVLCHCRFVLSAKGSSTGDATITLLFTSTANNILTGISVGYYEAFASSITPGGLITAGSASLQLLNATGTSAANLTHANFGNGTRCDFSFNYLV